ncbi:MAG TPA: quinone-dependent dihydroorotate dehydrogenase, partial [Anaerolineaceae bacterium]
LADYLVVNVSSPNTPGLRSLQAYQQLSPLLACLTAERSRLRAVLNRPIPLLVKLAPDLSSRDLDGALQAILDSGADGAILSNTSTRRDWLFSPAQCETGGLSGLGIQSRSTELVRAVHQRTGGRLPVIASGGIMSPEDAQEKLDAGAALVQLYTGLIFQGPGLPRRIAAVVKP